MFLAVTMPPSGEPESDCPIELGPFSSESVTQEAISKHWPNIPNVYIWEIDYSRVFDSVEEWEASQRLLDIKRKLKPGDLALLLEDARRADVGAQLEQQARAELGKKEPNIGLVKHLIHRQEWLAARPGYPHDMRVCGRHADVGAQLEQQARAELGKKEPDTGLVKHLISAIGAISTSRRMLAPVLSATCAAASSAGAELLSQMAGSGSTPLPKQATPPEQATTRPVTPPELRRGTPEEVAFDAQAEQRLGRAYRMAIQERRNERRKAQAAAEEAKEAQRRADPLYGMPIDAQERDEWLARQTPEVQELYAERQRIDRQEWLAARPGYPHDMRVCGRERGHLN